LSRGTRESSEAAARSYIVTMRHKKGDGIAGRFKSTFDFIAHEGMAFAVRHAGYLKARELTIVTALTIRKEQEEGRLRASRADVTVPLLHEMLTHLIISDWKKSRRPRAWELCGQAYAMGARELGTTAEETRETAIGSNWLFRVILGGEELPEIPEAGIRALADRDADIALVTDYLYLHLSDVEAKLMEDRLAEDAEFFEKAWPLVRANELGLDLYDFVDDEGNLVTPPQAKDESSPLYAYDHGSWRLEYPISRQELATMEEIFSELRRRMGSGAVAE
jgi:hypothetical protein